MMLGTPKATMQKDPKLFMALFPPKKEVIFTNIFFDNYYLDLGFFFLAPLFFKLLLSRFLFLHPMPIFCLFFFNYNLRPLVILIIFNFEVEPETISISDWLTLK